MDDEDEFDEWQQAQPQLANQPIGCSQQINQDKDMCKDRAEVDGECQHSTFDQKDENLISKQEDVFAINKRERSGFGQYCKQGQEGGNEDAGQQQTQEPVSDGQTQNNSTLMNVGQAAPSNDEGNEQRQSSTSSNLQHDVGASFQSSQNDNNQEGLEFSQMNKSTNRLDDQIAEQKVGELGQLLQKKERRGQQKQTDQSQKLEHVGPIRQSNFSFASPFEGAQGQSAQQQLQSEPIQEQQFSYQHQQPHQPSCTQQFDGGNNDDDQFGDYEEESNTIEATAGPQVIVSSSSLACPQKKMDPQANNKAMELIGKLPNYSYINASYFVDL